MDDKLAAALYSEYGLLLASLGQFAKAKNCLNNAYRICKKVDGEEHLSTVRCLGHVAKLDTYRHEYESAFKKYKRAFSVLRKIKGESFRETNICKNNCGKMLVMLKRYDEALNYLSIPFAIVSGREEFFLLFDYNKKFMNAPGIIISKKGASTKKMIKFAESKNLPIIENHALAKGIMNDCGQFEDISHKYYRRLAKILSKIIKTKGI